MINNDWRLLSYTGELNHKEFEFKNFIPTKKNGHEHCYFCWQKITNQPIKSEDDLGGYVTIIGKREDWVCQSCFNDFKKMFDFKVMGEH